MPLDRAARSATDERLARRRRACATGCWGARPTTTTWSWRATPQPLARALARAADAHAFALSEAFGAWRVVARDRSWQVDLLPLTGDSRSRPICAAAIFTSTRSPSRSTAVSYVDPFGGLSGSDRQRRLRMVSPRAFASTIRCGRCAWRGWRASSISRSSRTRRRPRGRSAPALAGVAAERIFAELKRIVIADRALDGLELMDALGVTDVVLPELSAPARRRAEPVPPPRRARPHAGGAGRGDRARARSGAMASASMPQPVARCAREPLANELTRGQALRFGALFHDVAKPQTRDVTPEGRVTFMGHDARGAEVAAAVADAAARQRAAARACRGAHPPPPAPRVPRARDAAQPARVYRYLRACEPVEVDVTLLSVADRLATRGRGARTRRSRGTSSSRVSCWARRSRGAPSARGRRSAATSSREAVGISRPGRRSVALLAELEEASFAGEIATPRARRSSGRASCWRVRELQAALERQQAAQER